jgi:hypothetical protein
MTIKDRAIGWARELGITHAMFSFGGHTQNATHTKLGKTHITSPSMFSHLGENSGLIPI